MIRLDFDRVKHFEVISAQYPLWHLFAANRLVLLTSSHNQADQTTQTHLFAINLEPAHPPIVKP